MSGTSHRATRRPSSASFPRRTPSSSSAVTGRSFARPARLPTSTSRCSGSTSARWASSRRRRRADSTRGWPSSSRAGTRSQRGGGSEARSPPGGAPPWGRGAGAGTRGGGAALMWGGDPPPASGGDVREATPTGSASRLVALNDIVVARGALARVCRLDVAIDDTHLATFIADGLVIASPTGSTGYSFSAGGPILDPGARNLIVTPIAAYLSAIRSVVVGPDQVVRCTVVDAVEALVSIDGRDDLPLAVGDVVEVRAMTRPIRFIEPHGSQPFWDLLRRKVALLPS